MANKTTLECRKHGLMFEQFDDWHEKENGPVPDCYICAHEKSKELKDRLAEVSRQRDLLLGAIEIKLHATVEMERSLSK